MQNWKNIIFKTQFSLRLFFPKWDKTSTSLFFLFFLIQMIYLFIFRTSGRFCVSDLHTSQHTAVSISYSQEVMIFSSLNAFIWFIPHFALYGASSVFVCVCVNNLSFSFLKIKKYLIVTVKLWPNGLCFISVDRHC